MPSAMGILAAKLGTAVPDQVALAHEHWDDCRIAVDYAVIDAARAEIEYLKELRGWLGCMSDMQRLATIAALRDIDPPAPVRRVLDEETG